MDEWLRQNRFPQIEFRSVNGERVACLKGRLEGGQVVMVEQGHRDMTKTARPLGLRPDQVRAALDYAAAYPEEIEAALAENRQGFDRLKRLLPQTVHT